MTIRSRLLLGFFTLILIFIGVVFINQRLSEQVIKNTNYLNNSETVIRNSNHLHKEMIEMQSGFRGFLLTNQKSFLSSYYSGLQTLPKHIKAQEVLLSSPEQRQRLDSIKYLHKEWVDYADSLINAKRDTKQEATQRYRRLFDNKLRMEVGKKLNDRIREVFQKFDNYEYELRLKRRDVLYTSISSTEKISLGLTLFSIIIVLLTSFFIIRTISTRISKMVAFSERIARGEFIKLDDHGRDELSSLIRSLNRMSETLNENFKELNKKNKELDEFGYVVSHDLKAPLRGIINTVSWIEEDHKDELSREVSDRLNAIKGRADRLENMINGLLEYARIGKVNRAPEHVDINEIINDLRSIFGTQPVTWIIQGIPITAKVDKIRLEQVFSNLISNAIKHNTSAAPVVSIHGVETEEYYRFSVTDNGPGIEQHYQEKIFMIFQTLQERDAFESTGVGLAIVKKIIEDQKGSIYVKSDPGKGSTFTFTWPKLNQ